MTIMYALVRNWIGFKVFTNYRVLEHSWASLINALQCVVELLCSCLCLFDIIIKVDAMDQMTFPLESERGFHVQ